MGEKCLVCVEMLHANHREKNNFRTLVADSSTKVKKKPVRRAEGGREVKCVSILCWVHHCSPEPRETGAHSLTLGQDSELREDNSIRNTKGITVLHI